MCYFERIDLSAHGFYITPGIKFDYKLGKGTPFNYYTYGASFAEVEIDTLTGDFHTRSADVVMDLGRSLNPAIDIGQVICTCNFLLECLQKQKLMLQTGDTWNISPYVNLFLEKQPPKMPPVPMTFYEGYILHIKLSSHFLFCTILD
jgi:Molybdopterin-binding domain of aldehyde dehydrogenase